MKKPETQSSGFFNYLITVFSAQVLHKKRLCSQSVGGRTRPWPI
jgi:hypothetical protein